MLVAEKMVFIPIVAILTGHDWLLPKLLQKANMRHGAVQDPVLFLNDGELSERRKYYILDKIALAYEGFSLLSR